MTPPTDREAEAWQVAKAVVNLCDGLPSQVAGVADYLTEKLARLRMSADPVAWMVRTPYGLHGLTDDKREAEWRVEDWNARRPKEPATLVALQPTQPDALVTTDDPTP